MPIGLPILVSAIGMLFGISPRSEQKLSATDGAP